jgi:hypothetical protein
LRSVFSNRGPVREILGSTEVFKREQATKRQCIRRKFKPEVMPDAVVADRDVALLKEEARNCRF